MQLICIERSSSDLRREYTYFGCTRCDSRVMTFGRQRMKRELFVPSTPDTVVRGHIPADRPPVMRVNAGDIVSIDTLSQTGLNTADGPVAFFARGGIKSEHVLKDAIE